jgi:Ferritin-like domain
VTTGAHALESHDLLVLSDVAQHAAIYRDFLKKVLGSSAIATLVTKYTYIDFTSRTSILWGGALFEDTGTGAYNGAGQFLTSGANLAVAGTIVSVHARHAAAIRDLISATGSSRAGTPLNTVRRRAHSALRQRPCILRKRVSPSRSG